VQIRVPSGGVTRQTGPFGEYHLTGLMDFLSVRRF
jgi:hypothetical protein